MKNVVRKANAVNNLNYKKATGEDYGDCVVLAEKLMNPILNTMKEKEEIASQIAKLRKL